MIGQMSQDTLSTRGELTFDQYLPVLEGEQTLDLLLNLDIDHVSRIVYG
jgi:hypothetical protein